MNIWQMRAKGLRCPKCDRFNDVIESPFELQAKPKAGDYTVCAGCSAIARFKTSTELELVNEEDLLEADPKMAELVAAVREASSPADAVKEIHRLYGKNIVWH